MDLPQPLDEATRRARLLDAEDQAIRLLDRVEVLGLVAAGRGERAVAADIYALAAQEFGVETHWHKRIVRAGANTLAIAADNPPERMIGADDMVFVDVGPVFGTWEADVGRSYAIGPDAAKHALCRALPRQFAQLRRRFLDDREITGTALYDYALAAARDAGWRFAGRIAGHIVSEFPHARLPGPKQTNHISPQNPDRLWAPGGDGLGRHWILEIHLTDPAGTFGGFYERLLRHDAESEPEPAPG